MAASSALPDTLAAYADAAGDLDDHLASCAGRLASALDVYRAGRPEFGGPISDLDRALRRLAGDGRRLDEWVGRVGLAFGRADDVRATLTEAEGHPPAVAGCSLLTPTRLRRRDADSSDHPLGEPLYTTAPLACGGNRPRWRPEEDDEGRGNRTAVLMAGGGGVAYGGEALFARKKGKKGRRPGPVEADGPAVERLPQPPYRDPPTRPNKPDGLRKVTAQGSVQGVASNGAGGSTARATSTSGTTATDGSRSTTGRASMSASSIPPPVSGPVPRDRSVG